MNNINYDWNGIFEAISYKNPQILSEELNKFFSDLKCVEVRFTDNTDKEIFGIIVKPMPLKVEEVFDYDLDLRFNKYSVEIDNKLFETMDASEIGATIVYEVNKIVSKESVDLFRDALLCYGALSAKVINQDNAFRYEKLFQLIMDDTVRAIQSIYRVNTKDNLIVADEFMKGIGLSENFDNAVEKINSINNKNMTNELCGKVISLQWYLDIINTADTNFRYIVITLQELLDFTASKLVKIGIVNAINELEPLTDSAKMMYTALTESASDKKKKMSLANQIKYSGLRSLEEDIFEYNMRIKNIENENEAILLMRQLSSRMEILDDYLRTEELFDTDRDRWQKVFDKYEKLRDDLSKKTVYKQKMYGLFVDYNALQRMSNAGQLDTYY